MKAKELRLMNESDLQGKIAELKKELMKMNSQIAAGTIPKNPSRVREMKKTIAKIYTINTEKAMGIRAKVEPKAAKSAAPKTEVKAKAPAQKTEAKKEAAKPAKKSEIKGGSKKE